MAPAPETEAPTDPGATEQPQQHDGFHVRLEHFEGPFDLLLQLISRRRLDITEVALAVVTDEFLAHLNAQDEWDLDEASEFLVVAATLLDRTAQLRQLAAQAQPMLPQLVELQRQRFLDRWNEALGAAQADAATSAAQERALAEATAFAIRIDVAEELTRLQSHLDEIERLIHKGGEVGKRLDFFIQELHREANTLGSKSSSLELTRISVDMKVLIEQMREQVQNIE